MAELIAASSALGVVSSLISVVGVAWRVVKRLDEYSERSKNVPQVIRQIRPQLRVLAGKMEELKQAGAHGSLATNSQSELSKAVETYEEQINLLDELTAKMLPNQGDSARTRAKKAMLSVYYEKQLSKIWAILETYKTTFIFHFTKMQPDCNPVLEVKPLQMHYHYPASISSRLVIRERPLREIEDAMSFPNTTANPTVVVLLGMGGSGKTQLALQYCGQSEGKRRFTSIFWVDASSPSATAQSFVTIAGIITNNMIDSKDEEVVLQLVKSRIGTWTDRWLLIFDNFDDPSAFVDKNIKEYFPRGENGAILFTSRHGDAERLGKTVAIAGMSEGEALELLFRQAECDNSEENIRSAKEIVARLGNLALAIDQAGAYISVRKLPLGLFMEHYNKRRETVLRETPTFWEYKRKLKTAESESSLSVYTTWEMSFDQLCRDKAGIAEQYLLTLSAFFDNTDILEAFFKSHFEVEKPKWMRQFETEGNWDSYEFQDMLARLRKVSLIRSLEITTSGARFSVHPLVQDWVKLKLDPQDRQSRTAEAIRILANFIMEQDVGGLTLRLRKTILSHLTASVQNEAIFLDPVEGLGSKSLLYAAKCFGTFYRERGLLTKAEAILDRALAGSEKELGKDDRMTLDIMNSLANLYRDQGRFSEAEAMYSRALTGYEKMFGGDDILALKTVNNLAILYEGQGRHAEAEVMYNRALAGFEKKIGRDHSWTLSTVGNLANLCHSQGRLAEAGTMYNQALARGMKVLGSDHRLTLNAEFQLGVIYKNRGKWAEAAPHYGRAAIGYERTLGPDNLLTLDAEYYLGLVQKKRGYLAEAATHYGRAAIGYEKTLGPDHTKTIAAKNRAMRISTQV